MTVDDHVSTQQATTTNINSKHNNSNNNNNNNKNNNTKSKPKAELILSRPSYQTGTSVLGTVRLTHNHNNHVFTSVHIYLAGRCRIDPRWHDAQSLAALYGTHPCHDRLPSFVEERVVDSYFGTGNDLDGGSSSPRRGSGGGGGGGRRRQLHLQLQRRKGLEKAACVCFWSTNVVTLWNVDGKGNGNFYENGHGNVYENGHGNKNMNMNKNGHGNKNINENKNENGYGMVGVARRKGNIHNDDNQNGGLIRNTNNRWEDWTPQPLILQGSEWLERSTRILESVQHRGADHSVDAVSNDLEYDDDDYDDSDYDYDDGDYDDNDDDVSEDDGACSYASSDEESTSRHDLSLDSESYDHTQNETGHEQLNHIPTQQTNAETTKEENEGNDTNGNSFAAQTPNIDTENNQHSQSMAFTFRVDLPTDIPPSANTASARYFYSAVLCVQTVEGEWIIIQAPFSVISQRSKTNANRNSISSTPTNETNVQLKIGTCTAFAHHSTHLDRDNPSPTLPCYISSTTKIETAKLSVDHHHSFLSPSSSILSSPSPDVRSLRVADEKGRPCCILTIIGSQTMTTPGGKILLFFDFESDSVLAHRHTHDNNDNDDDDGTATTTNQNPQSPETLLPCYRVAACLHGEELSRNPRKASWNTGHRNHHNRTRSYMFDSGCADVDSGYTESVSLALELPLDSPCTLRTNLVEVSIRCRVDITVERPGSSPGYGVLTLEFPCEVLQYLPEGGFGRGGNGGDGEDAEENLHREKMESRLADLMIDSGSHGKQNGNGDGDDVRKVISREVMNDLTMLSLYMMDG